LDGQIKGKTADSVSNFLQLVGKKEDRPGEVRLQSRVTVVTIKYSRFPLQKISVLMCEVIPLDGPAAGHPLANQKEIGVSDRLMVELRFAPGGRVAFECLCESVKRFVWRKFL